MGTVRLTDKRKSEYKARAQDMFEKANELPQFTPEETVKIMNALTNHPLQIAARDFIHEQRALYKIDGNSDAFLPFNIDIDTNTFDQIKCAMSDTDEGTTMCEFPTQLTLYGTDRSYYGHDGMHRWEFIPDKFFSDPREILVMQSAIRRVTDERREYREMRSKFHSGVADALENCNTLGQLIKLWPAAESLASEEDMRKLHTKETRTQAAKRVREEIDLDVSALNTTVLTANLIGD